MNYNGVPIDGVLEEALRCGAAFAELFFEETTFTNIRVESHKVDRAVTGTDRGVGLRLLSDGIEYYASTTDLTDSGVAALLKTLCAYLGHGGSNGRVVLPGPSRAATPVAKHPFGIGITRKADILLASQSEAYKIGDQIVQVQGGYIDSSRRIAVFSSSGTSVEDEQVRTTMTFNVILEKNGRLRTGYESIGGSVGMELFNNDGHLTAVRTAVNRAIKMSNSIPIEGGAMTVVLSSEAGGTMIHEAVGHGLEADHIYRDLSVYTGRLNEQVASPLISVVDDPTMPGMRGSFSYDDEGTPAARNTVIENGVLRNYLFDLKHAGDSGMRPTGNGRRESFRYPPIPRMTNTLILSGRDDPSSIISEVDAGLLVLKMGGGEVNTVTGDFVFEITEGHLIEHGRIGPPVEGAIMLGNGPAILKEIDRVGNDMGYGIGTCGKDTQGVPVADGQPTIRIPRIVVGGKK
ncbi:MAG: TldD/PmbA family protein [Deltaproteobacteria bacterium]|nr:TldD/PmbA family protein [Deltaproteobacteria bacterium]